MVTIDIKLIELLKKVTCLEISKFMSIKFIVKVMGLNIKINSLSLSKVIDIAIEKRLSLNSPK
jgi:hypothetical protein